KIFAKLGSDYKKPDAVTTMGRKEYKSKAWKLPVQDLLYVGRSSAKKLRALGIRTIGDLAEADESILRSHMGKMGLVLHAFANG
ncbi:DNA polymerase thumb domain-containing protein, partial [Streptomyces brasiliscabiei]|uniref:DNA polymerase thumb domain-containing protein n=1 Tax=Streptomyces brasiliscabiei TaxID=2736302 RepID=UPI0030142335